MSEKQLAEVSQFQKSLHADICLQETLNQWAQNNPLTHFAPTGKQSEFIETIAGDNFISVLSAGNGIGKTTLLVNVLGAFIYGDCGNPYFKYPTFNHWQYLKSARIISTPKEVEEIGSIQREIKSWWPKDKYESFKNGKMYDCEYRANNWIVDIMTYEQDLEQFEGANLSLILFNEPPPLGIFNACVARLRRGGKIIIFMTPLDTGGELIENLTEHDSIMVDGEPVGKVEIVYADIESACIEHGVRGYLQHKHIVQMLSFYDPEELIARKEGKPVTYSGRVYPVFNDKIHVIPLDEVPVDVQLYHLLDPHDGHPWAMKWIALDKTNTASCVDEYPDDDFNKISVDNNDYDDYAMIISKKEDKLFDIFSVPIHKRIIDPNYGNRTIRLLKRNEDNPRAKTSIKQELKLRGLEFEDGNDVLGDGHLKVREKLTYTLGNGELLHPPLYYICDNCRNSIRALLRYSYNRKITRAGDVKENPGVQEKYKHYPDLDRYFWMSNPKYITELKEFHPERQKVY